MRKHGHGSFRVYLFVLFLTPVIDMPSSESCPHWQKDVAPPLLRSKLDFPGRLKLQMMLFGAVLGEIRLSYVSRPKVTD